MKEERFAQSRIEQLKKWRKNILTEFDKWPTFYTVGWLDNQLKGIDAKIEELNSNTLN